MKILKRLSFIVGMPFFGILLLVLIIAMALATFIESSQGTNAAWALIYDAWWFEAVFMLVVINLIGNILRFKLYKKSKLSVFSFHLAFIFIIIGGGITRYFSSEGMMHIREGSMSGSIISNATYMDVEVKDGEDNFAFSKRVRLAAATPKKFKWKGRINGKALKISSKDYISNASVQYVAMPGGQPYIQLVLLAGGQVTAGLTSGEVKSYPGLSISFNNSEGGADLNIVLQEDKLIAHSPHFVSITAMGGEGINSFEPGADIPLEQGKLFSVNGVRLALQRFMPSAKMQYVDAGSSGSGSGMDVTRLEVEWDGMKSDLYLQGRQNIEGEPASVQMGKTTISCAYGSHRILLPFVLRLQDFRIDRYPGSHSPSSFESDVVLVDMEQNINEVHNIYMNNVLKHRGYRFYQSSYDQDEMGTILSVKKDFLGTAITYIGYILLVAGMLLALFVRGTRFSAISKSTAKNGAKTVILILAFLGGGNILNAQQFPAPSKEAAAEFGEIWVQGKEGRFKPMNTLSNEVVRKVLKKSRYEGLSADQVMLGMIAYPEVWKSAPIFEVDNAELHQMLGYKGSHVSFYDFLVDGKYILLDLANTAYNKRVQERTDLDKEVMKLDEKINVFYMVQTGALLKIFPDTDSTNDSWLAVSDLLDAEYSKIDSLGQVFLLYTKSLREGDMELASEITAFIQNYQAKNTQHDLIEGKKKAEILYNSLNIFKRLIRYYGAFGLMLLIMQFLMLFRPRKWVATAYKIDFVILLALFAVHTVFFILRWYVSGHAPLSNGYESMIFVSWLTLLAGLIFAKRTGFALALTAILAALSLLVANMSWMNPDIGNLVPVLKSPWLTIHVMVIMAGYAFLGLSMLMGLTNLIFYSVLSKKNKVSVTGAIHQLTQVNQLAVIIGLYFLTIGTFLGGVWANESWGRYWGWDPKETWALISVLVYSFITHMHNFPGMKGYYAFNLASLLGYFSILMTYFGVNYFLGGIHSYAGGAAFTIPAWVYISILALAGLSILANYKHKAFKMESSIES